MFRLYLGIYVKVEMCLTLRFSYMALFIYTDGYNLCN